MGRATEFIDFINRNPLPEDYEEMLAYITIDDKMKKLRKRNINLIKKGDDNQLELPF